MSEISAATAEEILDRAHGYCEACAGPLGTLRTAFHHRHPKGRGNAARNFSWLHSAINLMVVHGDLRWNCHNLTEYSIHQNPARSYRLGHLVHYGVHPGTVPVLVARNLRELRT